MRLSYHGQEVPIDGLDYVPGTLTWIGTDEHGDLLESSQLSAAHAVYVAHRMEPEGWVVIATAKGPVGWMLAFGQGGPWGVCYRCAGTGEVAHYRHINDGRCFQCQGSGMTKTRARELETVPF